MNPIWPVSLKVSWNPRALLLLRWLGITKILWNAGSSHFEIYETFIEILEKQIEQYNNTFNDEKPSQMVLNIKKYYPNKSKV